MSLDTAEEHGLNFVLATDADPKIEEKFVRRDEMMQAIQGYVVRNLDKHNAQHFLVFENIVESLFVLFEEESVITKKSTPLSGEYYRFNSNTFSRFRPEYLKSSEVHKLAGEIGSRYYPDAFEAIERDILDGPVDLGSSDQESVLDTASDNAEKLERDQIAPASDRVVTLSHNQIDAIEKPLDQVVSKLETENSLDGEEGLRELVIGRLKAGRELIRAGVFSVQSLHLTLVVGLQMIVEKYKHQAIGAVAGNLLALLLKEYGF